MKRKLLALVLAVASLVCFGLVSCGDTAETAYPVEFVFSDAVGKAGEFVTVQLTVNSSTAANAVLLHELDYDEDVLEFVSFANLGNAASGSIFGEHGMDSKTGTISIALAIPQKISGNVCDVTFRVKESAKPCTVNVSMRSVVKNTQTEIKSGVLSGTVTVTE